MKLPNNILEQMNLERETGKYVDKPYDFNRVFLQGNIKFLEYRLVDRGPICALVFIKLEVRSLNKNPFNGRVKSEKEILNIVARDYVADYIYQNFNVGDKAEILGHLRKVKRGYIVVIEDID